ncbi:hypothetical protein ABIV32_001531 [Salmonella enterica subsp. enterica]
MNKFNRIESIGAELIASSFDEVYNGIPSKIYILAYEGKEYAAITSHDEHDNDVLLYSLSKNYSETIHGEYNCLFWDAETLKHFLSGIGGA